MMSKTLLDHRSLLTISRLPKGRNSRRAGTTIELQHKSEAYTIKFTIGALLWSCPELRLMLRARLTY